MADPAYLQLLVLFFSSSHLYKMEAVICGSVMVLMHSLASSRPAAGTIQLEPNQFVL